MTAIYPFSSSVAWGDYNNDGRLDFLLTGHCYPSGGTGSVSQLWQNTGTGFTNVTDSVGLPQFGLAAWVDFDNDGRLDLVCTEYGAPQLWRNTTPVTNTLPSAPTGLAMTATTNAVMLSRGIPPRTVKRPPAVSPTTSAPAPRPAEMIFCPRM